LNVASDLKFRPKNRESRANVPCEGCFQLYSYLAIHASVESGKEQLEAELKHHQGIDKFRMPDLKLIRQELKEWLKGLESKKIALHSLIKQITVYTNATLEVTYNAGYLSNQTRALDYTP